MSIFHLAMKFPSTVGDIVIVHLDQKIARECYVVSLKIEPTRRLHKTLARGWSRERTGR